MNRQTVRFGGPYEDRIGYARAVRIGATVYVAGCTGAGGDGVLPTAVEEQCRNALATIGRALTEAGSGFGDVVRVRYILPDPADFEPCWPLLRAAFGAVPPAATMIAAGLIDPAMKIEIEVTAVIAAR